jgi:hypothetical protein
MRKFGAYLTDRHESDLSAPRAGPAASDDVSSSDWAFAYLCLRS